ncbi:MAG: hypothetical protein LQ346_004235 [Caloplaca aetnensis]|nr:MAG: hypothetical protein LQ346_004235 [Caloplaca aetnensis]
MAGSDSIEDLKRQLREKDQLIKEQSQLLQRSTMLELLDACHKHFDALFTVELNPRKSTAGAITKPDGKVHPAWLKPWLDFPRLQSDTFQRAQDQLHPPGSAAKRQFHALKTIEEQAEGLQGLRINSEAKLRTWQNSYVDPYVKQLCGALGANVSYPPTPHALVPDPYDILYPPPATSVPESSRPAPKSVNADQFCVYRHFEGDQELLSHVVELKAPHKMRGDILRNSVMNEAIIDVAKVRDKYFIPIDRDEKAVDHGQRLLAAATTQTYDYMLECGCLYGCIVTGETLVFLKIDEEDTTTLYYHIADPFREAEGESFQGFQPSKTSVAQALTFFLMASPSIPYSQGWVQRAKAAAQVWTVDHGKISPEKTPKKRRKQLAKLDRKDISYSKSRPSTSNRSPVKTRSRNQQGCNPAGSGAAQGDQDSSDDDYDEEPHDITSPSKQPAARQTAYVSKGQGNQQASCSQTSSQKQQKRPYCTQACMLGLVQQGPVDEACPNAAYHPRGEGGTSHALTAPKLCELLRQQLARTMDQDIEDLGLQGARGMAFKLSLASHGYTVIGKATIDFYVPELIHERRVYQRLRGLQGSLVPVCLGDIDLVHPWYCPGTHLVHMLLLSYGGEPIREIRAEDEARVTQFETALRTLGVRHADTRPENTLWNREIGQLMFIDFERSFMTGKVPSDFKIPTRGTKKRKAEEQLSPCQDESNRTTKVRKDPAVLAPVSPRTED